ncbi:MAG: tRNA lysidine(34) synthetase TilS [Eubacteriales bacterium]|nr:tRNA lysidine(34) synthetase TilS [Eubacteriales bacterium]
MKRTVWNTIQEEHLLSKEDRVLCALSGGADSVSLLLCLHELGIPVCACHLNHSLRGAQSDGDEEFCRELCRRMGIPFLSRREDAARAAKERGQSLETAARELRYAFFDECARELGATKIATAHTADDNLETILFRLIRGTGAAGLAGIPPRRGIIVRPLLHVERREVEAFLTARGQEWRTDATNLEDVCTRNRIRHQVIPALREIAPDAADHAGQTASLLRQDNDALDALAQDNGALDWLNRQPEAIRSRSIRKRLCASGVPEGELTYEHVRAVGRLCRKGRGSVSLPGGYTAQIRQHKLHIGKVMRPEAVPVVPEQPVVFGEYTNLLTQRIEWIANSRYTIRLSYDIIEKNLLTVRSWRPTDRMLLPGARGARSLKRLYAERGIPPLVRDGLPVLCAGDTIAAAAGIGAADGFFEKEKEKQIVWTIRRTEGENRYDAVY